MTVTGTITQEDIDKGTCSSPFKCALAVSLRRVGLQHIRWCSPMVISIGEFYKIAEAIPSEELFTWMRAFDLNKTAVAPIDYTLEFTP